MKILKGLLTGAAFQVAVLAHAQHPVPFTAEDRFYKEGIELFDKGQYGSAQEALGQYLALGKTDVRSVEAQYLYAVSGLYLFHPNAESQIQQFIAQHPDHPKASMANFELGNFYFNQKEYDKAIEFFEKVASDKLEYEKQKEAEFKQGYSYFAQKKFKEALAQFNKNKGGDHKYSFASSYYSGYLSARNGDFKTAKADLRVAEKNDAYKLVVPAMLTEILYKEGDMDGLIAYGEEVLARKSKPQNAENIQLLVGEAYYVKSDWAKAADNFGAYVAANKSAEPAIRYKLGYSLYKAKKFPEAIAQFKSVATQRDSIGQSAAYNMGLSYLQSNNKQYALAAFDEARKANYDKNVTEQARFKFGQMHYEMGNSREVIQALGSFRKDYPKSKLREEADDILSEAYLNSNNYAEAMRHIEGMDTKSDRVKRTYQRVALYQGVNMYNDSRFLEAVQALDKSIQYPYEDTLAVAANFWKGEAFSAQQKWDEAQKAYETMFRIPKAQQTDYNQRGHYGLGYAYYNDKQYSKALVHFKSFVNAEGSAGGSRNRTDATLRMADCYYVSKNYSEAIENYNKVIAANSPDADYAYFQKGVILSITGKRDDAKENLELMARKFPASRYVDDAVYQRAQIDFESGNYAPAIAGFTTLIDEKKVSRLVPNALQKRGLAYVNLKKYSEAISDFQRVINEFPSSKVASNTLYSLQEALASAGRSEEFDTYLAKFKSTNPKSDALESIEFEAAKTLYFNEKYLQAITKFESYLKAYPGNKFAIDARYFLADSYYRTGNKTTASAKLKEVVTENKSEYVNRAVYRVAEIAFEAKNYTEALQYYTRLRDNATSKKELSNALVGIVKSHYGAGDYASTKQVATTLIEQGNVSVNALNIALLYRGKASYAQSKYDDAINELTAAVNQATDESGAEAQYLIAEALFKQQKYKESQDACYKVNDNFASYDYWRGKAFLLLADNFIALKEDFQARATLNSIIDNSPVKEIVAEAKTKLATLGGSESGTKESDSSPKGKNKKDDSQAAPGDSLNNK